MEPNLILHRKQLASLCRRHRVARLEVFGSAANGKFDPLSSDYDFIVRFAADPAASLARRFVALGDALERLLGRRVDLMTDHPIDNPYLRAAVDATRTTLHDESPSEAPV